MSANLDFNAPRPHDGQFHVAPRHSSLRTLYASWRDCKTFHHNGTSLSCRGSHREEGDTCMVRRRKGTVPHRTMWTDETVQRIDAYQAQHHLSSFSVAAETLVRLGLEQSPAEIITPIVASAVHHAVHRELDRLIRIQIYTAIDAGMAYRFAAAACPRCGPPQRRPARTLPAGQSHDPRRHAPPHCAAARSIRS